ncbi:MAG TPA: CpsD/CapB family tyrosine-protein kinase, partial [Methylovirgula sp.]
FGVAFFREMTDRVFRTDAEVESRLQVNCLAMMPAIQSSGAGAPPDRRWSSKIAGVLKSVALRPVEPRRSHSLGRRTHGAPSPAGPDTPGTPRLDEAASASREISQAPGLLRHVLDLPFSQFTEALRSLKVVIDLNGAVQANKVIGVTSSIPNEGKSTIAANLAELIAFSGARTILVDADLRNPSLSRHFAPNADIGFVDIVSGRVERYAVLWKDTKSGLDFLPVGNAAKLMHSHDILGSESTKKLLAALREDYDYVIVDFAPLAPVVDTRASSHFIDSYIYVVEWGRTQTDVVEHSLSVAHEIYDRLLGVVLNKADMNTLRRYDHYRSNYYYKKYYSRYGYTA